MRNNVNRLYKDLAWLWPIWEDVEEYRRESELFAGLIKQYAGVEVREERRGEDAEGLPVFVCVKSL